MDDCILALYCVLCIILLIIINRLDRLENRLHTLIKGNQNRDKFEAEEIDTKLDEAIKHYEELSKERYLFNPHNKDLYEWLKELRDRRMEN